MVFFGVLIFLVYTFFVGFHVVSYVVCTYRGYLPLFVCILLVFIDSYSVGCGRLVVNLPYFSADIYYFFCNLLLAALCCFFASSTGILALVFSHPFHLPRKLGVIVCVTSRIPREFQLSVLSPRLLVQGESVQNSCVFYAFIMTIYAPACTHFDHN